MKISDIYKIKKHTISFEFFPPKTDDGERKLFDVVRELKVLKPAFISVTYGAMGTTRDNTLRIVSEIKNKIGIEAAAHLTCVSHNRSEIETVLENLAEKGIDNIVALRGDPPKGETEFKPVPQGFRYAAELVSFIKTHPKFKDKFSLAVAGYPEGHVECKDKEADLKHLQHKVEQGADAMITQLFLDNNDYFRFVDRVRKMGIGIPVVPGMMPVTHGPQIKKFSEMCGAKIPSKISDAIERYGDDQASIEAFGIEYAVKQCEGLLAFGVPGFHFYTLNKSSATIQIHRHLFA